MVELIDTVTHEAYHAAHRFATNKEQDKAVINAAEQYGRNFGSYNITNNCSQYTSKALSAGGIETTQHPIPNKANAYARANNKGLVKNDSKKNK